MKIIKTLEVTLFTVLILFAIAIVASPTWANSNSVNSYDLNNNNKIISNVDDCAWLQAQSTNRVVMYRLYNPYSGEHFYTGTEKEKRELVAAGWKDEGQGWVAPKTSDTPVYRLYNPYTSDHHFTTDKKEYNDLGKAGWRQEDIGWYSAKSTDVGAQPLYRLFNPYATVGTHHYTLLSKERDELVKAGWRDEGIGWYGFTTMEEPVTKLKSLDVTVDTSSKTYTGKQITPLVTSKNLKLGTDYKVSYGTNKNVGDGTITVTGIGSYTGTMKYTFSIVKREVTITWGNVDLTYNGTNQTPLCTLGNVVSGDNVKVTLEGAKKDVGEAYVVKASSLSNSNYKLPSANSTTFRIAEKEVGIQWGKTSFVYDATPHVALASATGVCGGDVVDVSVSGEMTNVGSGYVATATSVNNPNYRLLTQETITFDIIQREITEISGIKAKDKQYNSKFDATLDFQSLSIVGKIETDDLSISANAEFEGKYVKTDGTKTKVNISDIKLTGSAVDNYKIADDAKIQSETYADIIKKVVSVSGVTISDKTYDSKIEATVAKGDGKVKIEGIEGNDDVGVSVGSANAYFEDADAGVNKNVYLSGLTLTGDDKSNYKLASAGEESTLKATIYPKEIGSVSWGSTSLDYNGTPLAPTATITKENGVIENDLTVSVQVTVEGEHTDAGNYEAKASGLINNTNYKLKDDIKTNFIINKVDYSYKAPVNLVSHEGQTLSDVTIPTVEGGIFTWVNPLLSVGEAGTHSFKAKFTPNDTKNYNVVEVYLEVKVKAVYTVTFDSNGGSYIANFEQKIVDGETACDIEHPTREGCEFNAWTLTKGVRDKFDFSTPITQNITLYVIWDFYSVEINFDTQLHGNSNFTKSTDIDGKAITTQADFGTSCGLTFEGWYENPECSGSVVDLNTQTFISPKTLYANWIPTIDDENGEKSYWIAPSSKITTGNTNDKVDQANSNYVKAGWNVKKSATEIRNDVNVLTQGESNSNYESVKSEYEEYMKNDNYHLYTKYNGDKTDGTSRQYDENGYVEFRIIEVGTHNSDVEGGGESLTFQATHFLPTAQENACSGTFNPWYATSLCNSMNNSNGEIYMNFNSAFIADIKEKKKMCLTSRNSCTKSNFLFWIASVVELNGTNENYFKDEGTQYEYFSSIGVNATGDNPALVRHTRSGNDPMGFSVTASTTSLQPKGRYWTRSNSEMTVFSAVTETGCLTFGDGAFAFQSSCLGVVPCFCFGSVGVTFDTQGHGNDTYTTYVDQDGKVSTSQSDYGTSEGLKFEGWYDNPECTGEAIDLNSKVFDKSVTLYANWIPTEEGDMQKYWIAPSYKTTTGYTKDKINQVNPDFVKEAWNVKKSSAEIQEDVKILSEGESNPKYDITRVEYKNFMTNDNYHLYTKWNGSTDDSGGTDASGKNGYVEFRIIEVGSHDLSSGSSSDVLTFEATHLLTVSSQMNSSGRSEGGWANTDLRKSLNSGAIFNSFNSGFTKDVVKVRKNSLKNVGSSDLSTGLDKFWICSSSEYIKSSDDKLSSEGSPYDYYTRLLFDGKVGFVDGKNGEYLSIVKYTRAGRYPKSLGGSSYWHRTIDSFDKTKFVSVNLAGYGSNNYVDLISNKRADANNGVVPCFCFGTSDASIGNVTFDTQGHGNFSVSPKQIDSNGKVTAPILSMTQLTSASPLAFDGWYDNPACKGDKIDFNSKVFEESTTVYACWKLPQSVHTYWIAPSSKILQSNNTIGADSYTNPNYVNERWNIKKTQSEIQNDVKKIKAGITSTINEYKSYMNNDDFHLYTDWTGDTADKEGSSDLNSYVEFRIIQVGEHDGDGSGLTFQAIHSLPEAQKMLSKRVDGSFTNDLGEAAWGYTYVKKEYLPNLPINEALKNDVISVNKKSRPFDQKYYSYVTTSDKFWIAGRAEMSGLTNETWAEEGPQYDFYYNRRSTIQGDSGYKNSIFIRKTRAGNLPKSNTNSDAIWFLRTGDSDGSEGKYYFGAYNSNGDYKKIEVNNSMYKDQTHQSYGIVPCFCF